MARNPRFDLPGSWHHVMNRAIARRTLFEARADIRFFLARLAGAVRRGQLEVHAWCVLTTHFHLLVRSPVGELSEAMRQVQNDYVRRFNRGRRRDGPLVRGRFISRPVRSLAYRELLVRYIDLNPVQAGLAPSAVEYPWCSAASYARVVGPPWLSRDWVEGLVQRRLERSTYDPADYARAFDRERTRRARALVERRLRGPQQRSGFDPLDHLVEGAPVRVLRWLRAKARLADGGRPGLPVSDPRAVRESLDRVRAAEPEWRVATNRKSRSGWDVVEVGLLRDLCGAGYAEIATRLGVEAQTARRVYRLHAELLEVDEGYGERVMGTVIGTVPRQMTTDSSSD